MAEGDVNPDRRRAQEEGYFRRRDQELMERQGRRAEAEAERRLIAQAIGVDDDETVQDLQMAGYKADTIVLLELAPPVQVAWADGSVSKHERELLLRIAAREHVETNSPAHTQLGAWLESAPPVHLFDASVRAISHIVASLRPDVGVALRRKLIDDCGTIAAASGSFLNWGRSVSKEEQQVIHRIATAIS